MVAVSGIAWFASLLRAYVGISSGSSSSREYTVPYLILEVFSVFKESFWNDTLADEIFGYTSSKTLMLVCHEKWFRTELK